MASSQKYIHWIFLLISIFFEVGGTFIMKVSHSWNFALGAEMGLGIMWLFLGISYFSLAKATLVIPIGVAFALWDALGLMLIVGVSFFVLQEALTVKTSLGLLCVLLGGLLVHLGTENGLNETNAQNADAQGGV